MTKNGAPSAKPNDEQWDRMRDLVRKAVEKFPKPIRLRAMNACEGIEKAEALLDMDREIASFRAITAQEEAATALFMVLKRMNYPGAARLNAYTHAHKAALWFIVDAAHRNIGQMFQDMQIKLTVDASAPSVGVGIPLSYFGVSLPDHPDLAMQPVDPFHMFQSQGGKAYLFENEISALVSDSGARSADRYIRDLANARNKLLYASDSSLPKSRARKEDITSRRDRIYTIMILCIGVLQTTTIQHLVEQGLQALLGLIGKSDDLRTIEVTDNAEISLAHPRAQTLS